MPLTPSPAHWQWSREQWPRCLTSAAPARKDQKAITRKVWGTVKWFSVRTGYGFINRNGTKEDVFVEQTVIKNSPRKSLGSVRDGETVDLDVEGEKGAEAADVTGLVELQRKAVDVQQTLTITKAIHVARVLSTVTSRTTRVVRVGERMMGESC